LKQSVLGYLSNSKILKLNTAKCLGHFDEKRLKTCLLTSQFSLLCHSGFLCSLYIFSIVNIYLYRCIEVGCSAVTLKTVWICALCGRTSATLSAVFSYKLVNSYHSFLAICQVLYICLVCSMESRKVGVRQELLTVLTIDFMRRLVLFICWFCFQAYGYILFNISTLKYLFVMLFFSTGR
jgi:hypothetical protein